MSVRSVRSAGFSDTAKKHVLPVLKAKLEALGVDVYEPFARNEQNGLGPLSGDTDWAFDIAYADRDGVKMCDGIFACINGLPPDEGAPALFLLLSSQGRSWGRGWGKWPGRQ